MGTAVMCFSCLCAHYLGMHIVFWVALILSATLCLIHVISVCVAVVRCRPKLSLRQKRFDAPVTVIRPVCGVDNYCEETLRSTFLLDYVRYEILFCVAVENDPVVTIVQRLIDEHPGVRARLLIGDERISQNPKLNNIWKGCDAAAGAWIIIADSNVLMPRDYVQQLLAAWEPDTGLVCSPPIGCRPGGFWAELECAFLNTYQARWQYFANSMGNGFAQGKTMLWRRDDLNSVGLSALARDAAEDAAATKLVRSVGKRVRLVDGPFKQPLGQRTAAEVWRRQVRWARLRRDAFVECYAMEIFSTSWLAIAAAAVAALAFGMSPLSGIIPLLSIWYGSEAALAISARWPLSVRSPIAWLLRDLLLPVLWAAGWFGSKVQWRGTPIPITNKTGTLANLGGA